MTRKILFRGFHPCEDGDTAIHVDGKAVKGRWLEGLPSYAIDGTISVIEHFNSYCNCEIFEVIPATVGQHTGLTDKGGKQAFGGDRAIYHDENYTAYGAIKFGEIPDDKLKHIGFYIEWENDGDNKWGDWWRNDIGFYLENERCKISGTIFDKEDTP